MNAKLSKCNFLNQVHYLGHVISADGIATNPSKTEQIMDWLTSRNVQEVQQFLGLGSYYWRSFRTLLESPNHCTALQSEEGFSDGLFSVRKLLLSLNYVYILAPLISFPDFSLLGHRCLPVWH